MEKQRDMAQGLRAGLRLYMREGGDPTDGEMTEVMACWNREAEAVPTRYGTSTEHTGLSSSVHVSSGFRLSETAFASQLTACPELCAVRKLCTNRYPHH